jgi:7,8-dihydropterin-6-yl-methyl-4-(beta-D-ribofuranosyl)aminobenzene 5'-phosphate synthase
MWVKIEAKAKEKVMTVKLKEVDKVEILTLQDNYIDVAAFDGTEIVQRALPIKDMEFQNSILAEHGFSAIVAITTDDKSRGILFDFGFSEHGAAFNADALGVDLSTVESMVLSHGHRDHYGGLEQLAERVGKKGIELVVHPTAFRTSRYIKVSEEFKINLRAPSREKIEDAGVSLVESEEPRMLLDDSVLFLKKDFLAHIMTMMVRPNGTPLKKIVLSLPMLKARAWWSYPVVLIRESLTP